MIKPLETKDEWFNHAMNTKMDLIAYCIDSSKYYKYAEIVKNLIDSLSHTRIIDFKDESRIAYRKYPGSKLILPYFQAFYIDNFILIFVSIIVISLLLSWTMDRKHFINILFDTLNMLYAHHTPYTYHLQNRLPSRILKGTWLVTSMLLSILFCSRVLDDKLRAVPELVIDSWEDLQHKPGVIIITTDDDPLFEFTTTSDSDMALDFKARIDAINVAEQFRKPFLQRLVNELSSGKSAFVNNRLSLIFFMIEISKFKKSGNEFLESMHISKSGGPTLPYFMGTNVKNSEPFLQSFDET